MTNDVTQEERQRLLFGSHCSLRCRPSDRNGFLYRMPRHGVACEIGVFRGDFSESIYRIVQPSKLYLVDGWDEDVVTIWDGKRRTGEHSRKLVEWRFCDEIAEGVVELIPERSPMALDKIPSGSVDFVYIDGSHHFCDVLADLEASLRIVRRPGWICGHDYCEIFNYGVPRAVRRFCLRHGLRVNILTDETPGKTGNRYGINENVPEKVAYNSFGIFVEY